MNNNLNLETISREKIEFNWDDYESQGHDSKTFKKRINSYKNGGIKNKSKEEQKLYSIYFESLQDYEPKDLIHGKNYICIIDKITPDIIHVSTKGGQSLYIDVDKERRLANRLGITGIEFIVGEEIEVQVNKIDKNKYRGSVCDCYINNLKREFIDQITKEKSAYTAKIESTNRGGYIANISGIKCFLPGSLAAANKITDFEEYIGKEIPVMIENYIEDKDIFVVSHKKYINKVMEHKIGELNALQQYTGTVTGTSDFGIFVEWDELYTGLIHKSELKNEDEISKYREGDEISFYVKGIRDNNKIVLSLDEPTEKIVQLNEMKEKMETDTIYIFDAIFKYKNKNGLMVEIPKLNSFALIENNSFELKEGEMIVIKITNIDPMGERIFAEIYNE